MKRQLDGMAVVITGASAGIGRALAERLAQRGCRLALAARRLDRLEELNRSLGGNCLVIQADVAQSEDCARIIQTAIAHFGRLDTVVANAGYGINRSIAQTSAEDWQAIVRTNLFGTTDLIRAALPHMLNQDRRQGRRGQVVIVSSAIARRTVPHFGAYAATKAAQLSVAEALRVEMRSQDIAVTSVHPIGTTTEFFDVAAQKSPGASPSRRLEFEFMQSPQTVARRIVAAIERPRAEVWPSRLSRFMLSGVTLFPQLADRLLSRRLPEGK